MLAERVREATYLQNVLSRFLYGIASKTCSVRMSGLPSKSAMVRESYSILVLPLACTIRYCLYHKRVLNSLSVKPAPSIIAFRV